MHRKPVRHAIVIGASMAGLATARVLADHADIVTVLDRDELPLGYEARKGVPQGRHAHAILAGGAKAIEALFPGIMAEMVADGAGLLDFNSGYWFQAGGYRAKCLIERQVVSASRPFLEGNVRARLAAVPNVRIRSGCAVESLLATGDRVRGVRVFDGRSTTDLDADLVVDCSGRASQASHWMGQLGFPSPDVDEVRCDMRYATLVLRRSPSDLDGTFAICIEAPPAGKRAAFLVPIEGNRWILTIGASFGAAVPADEDQFRAAVATLPSGEIAQVMARAEVVAPIAHHRMVTSKRRRYERLRRLPAGFMALGDAVCSFNPIYGQGMSSAVLQAVALGECIAAHDNDQHLARAFYARAAKVIDTPWSIAVGADFAYPECRGPKPFGTDLVNRYMRKVLIAARVSPEVNTAMIMVQNLVAPPTSLFKPAMVLRVRRAARTVERESRRPAPTVPAPVATRRHAA
jgi:2-polyprenyl-6-methoxyphenol hydroxylase-like FAD-dependent oxidoreductase